MGIAFVTFKSPEGKNTYPLLTPDQLEYFDLSALDTIIDYKPRNTIGQVYSDIKFGNHIWAVKIVELNKAPITLSGLRLTYVKDSSELGIFCFPAKNFPAKCLLLKMRFF